jgi:hypothetical protein
VRREALWMPGLKALHGSGVIISNIAIGPAPHGSERRREHCFTVLASIAVIPGMNKIVGQST